MPQLIGDRTLRQLNAAEGYLMLGLAGQALDILESRPDWATMQFEASFLTGQALRALERHREALRPLEIAAALRPGDLGVALALGWCYKRTHRLAQAIDALELAAREHPDEALLHYNLACYWSLAHDRSRSLEKLALALELEPDLRHLVASESDFNPIRDHPDFERVLAGQAPRG